MWYFTWILGLGFACAFAALNAMWLELGGAEPALVAAPRTPPGPLARAQEAGPALFLSPGRMPPSPR